MVDNCGQNFSIALKIVALSQGPVLFHCTLGKDRTGVLGMLLLHILGASEQAIIFDYSLTECASEMYHNYAKKFIVDMSGLPESFCRATADVMRLTIDYVKRTYGSIDLYLDRFSFGPEWRSYLRRKYLTS
ncbi:protein tyrosine/serine phosphatase [Gregarina niphandrodes]|uniref:Protein tyrosine/serine phosphatase n=1 Tax=Gregarina niphandrodes TaxID=110365 RepID=A0A023B346_GRENI|nr:protein tyrosine/serine phosphatase [Gregarina niphandrodes]EZG55364.1 protein tyrosine/serine phosphatase [Gregarina niphandrodes]|eukprot:XP_011131611.1 protein tyrosine/serine phosphatase [Gregarina niphandrodes]